jgi:hypothetical protein
MGMDQVVNSDQLAQLVQTEKLRFIYQDSRNNNSGISSWVFSHCVVVPGFEATARNTGAPGGIGNASISTSQNGGSASDFGAMQISLYDCGSDN